MRNGLKLYFKHLLTLFILIFALVAIIAACDIKGEVFMFLFFSVFLYLCSFLIGAVFRKGPLKGVGVGILRDRKEELEELKSPKQPWE